MANLDAKTPADELVAHVGWIRRLARQLVGDRELAEELVQEACVVALEDGPDDRSRVRRWLGAVVRNLVRQRARGEIRRRDREVLSARSDEDESTAHLVERVAVQRQLTDEVLALDEPYRSVVLLRFFDELPPRKIAERLDVPVATVNSRLQRALAQLRVKLDESEHGTRWMSALLPFVAPVPVPVSPTIPVALGPTGLGAFLMQTKITLIVGVSALAGVLIWSARDIAGPSRDVVESSRNELPFASSPLGADADLRAVPGQAERRSLGAAEDPTARPPSSAVGVAASVPASLLRARVLDAAGAPVAGATVAVEGSGESLGISGAGGWLEVPVERSRATLVVSGERWVTVKSGEWRSDASYDPVVVIAPVVDLAGIVRSPEHTLPGARIRFGLPHGFAARFRDVMDATQARAFEAVADGRGYFELPRVPAIEGARLFAHSQGFERGELAVPPHSDRRLEFLLERPVVSLEGGLRGRVVDAVGAPVEGAHVALGLTSVATDDEGLFALDLRRAVSAAEITAVKAGFLPVRTARPFEPGPEDSGWPDFIELRLGETARSISGVVRDGNGKPVVGASVWLADPTPSWPIGFAPMNLEGLMAGAPIPPIISDSVASLPPEDGDSFNDFVQLAGPASALWNWVATDSNGRFEVGGLDRRHYTLAVLLPDSLEIHTSDPIRAGTANAVIGLPRPDVYSRVAGVVRSPAGAPLAGIVVSTWIPVFDVTGRVFGGSAQVVLIKRGESTTTDVAGKFELEDIPRSGVRLSIKGDEILPDSFELEYLANHRKLDLVAYQRCHLQIESSEESESFDAFAVTDEHGKTLDLMLLASGGVEAYDRLRLTDGASGVVAVTNRARRLLLLRGGEVVEQRSLDLVAGEVNRIEL